MKMHQKTFAFHHFMLVTVCWVCVWANVECFHTHTRSVTVYFLKMHNVCRLSRNENAKYDHNVFFQNGKKMKITERPAINHSNVGLIAYTAQLFHTQQDKCMRQVNARIHTMWSARIATLSIGLFNSINLVFSFRDGEHCKLPYFCCCCSLL